MARVTKLDQAINDLQYKVNVLTAAIAQLEAQKTQQGAKASKPRLVETA